VLLRDSHCAVCKTCIVSRFVTTDSKKCPTCNCDLGAHPLQTLRYDRTIQSVIDKVFPELEKQDIADEEAFNKQHNIVKRVSEAHEEIKHELKHEASHEERDEPVKRARHSDGAKQISFELRPASDEITALLKPVLRVPHGTKVSELKGYIAAQLQLEKETEEKIVLLYNEMPLKESLILDRFLEKVNRPTIVYRIE
jgi:hypothetical protein